MGLFFRQSRGRVVFANEDRIVGFLGKAARENSAAFCQARDENGFFWEDLSQRFVSEFSSSRVGIG